MLNDMYKKFIKYRNHDIKHAKKVWEQCHSMGCMMYDEEWDKRAWQFPEELREIYSDLWNVMLKAHGIIDE